MAMQKLQLVLVAVSACDSTPSPKDKTCDTYSTEADCLTHTDTSGLCYWIKSGEGQDSKCTGTRPDMPPYCGSFTESDLPKKLKCDDLGCDAADSQGKCTFGKTCSAHADPKSCMGSAASGESDCLYANAEYKFVTSNGSCVDKTAVNKSQMETWCPTVLLEDGDSNDYPWDGKCENLCGKSDGSTCCGAQGSTYCGAPQTQLCDFSGESACVNGSSSSQSCYFYKGTDGADPKADGATCQTGAPSNLAKYCPLIKLADVSGLSQDICKNAGCTDFDTDHCTYVPPSTQNKLTLK